MHKHTIFTIGSIEQQLYISSNPSGKLMVIFPGMGYNCDKPLLHYAKKVGMDKGFSVLCIKYGSMHFQKSKVLAALEPTYQMSRRAVEYALLVLDASCKDVVFISKSLGTVAAGRITEQLEDKNSRMTIRNFFLTPLEQTLPFAVNPDDYLVYGTDDPMSTKEVKQAFSDTPLHISVYEGADHSLEVEDDNMKSIEYLKEVVKSYENVIKI